MAEEKNPRVEYYFTFSQPIGGQGAPVPELRSRPAREPSTHAAPPYESTPTGLDYGEGIFKRIREFLKIPARLMRSSGSKWNISAGVLWTAIVATSFEHTLMYSGPLFVLQSAELMVVWAVFSLLILVVPGPVPDLPPGPD